MVGTAGVKEKAQDEMSSLLKTRILHSLGAMRCNAAKFYPFQQGVRRRWTPWDTDSLVMLGLALILFVEAYGYGVSRGMDRLFGGPLDTRAQQMAAAISDTAYGMDLRYGAHGAIKAALTKGGMSDVPENLASLGLKYPDNVRNTKLWNDLLEKVTHLDYLSMPPRTADGTLVFIHSEDLGVVDFFKLSFHLFGYNIQGFYNTYFLLFGTGLILVFVAFWSRPGVLMGANFLLFGFLFAIYRLDYTVDSIADGRSLATLAILPIYHLMVLLWTSPRWTVIGIVSAAFQVILLMCVVTMRGSAQWGVILLGISIFALIIWKARSCWSTQPISALVRSCLTWPMIVIVLVSTTFSIYHRGRIHPAYFVLDETNPGHLFWHSLAYGLSDIPDIDAHIPGLNGVRGDGLPTYLGNAYLKKIMGYEPPSLSAYYASDFFPYLGRMKTYERVVRAAYLDYIREHPFQMLSYTFITKPYLTVTLFFETVSRVAYKYTTRVVLFGLTLILALRMLRPTVRLQRDLTLGSLVIGGMTLAVSLPAVVTYPTRHAGFGDITAVYCALLAALLTTCPLWAPALLARIRQRAKQRRLRHQADPAAKRDIECDTTFVGDTRAEHVLYRERTSELPERGADTNTFR